MRKALTLNQLDVWSFVDKYIEKNGRAPSQLEIGKALEIRQGNVGKYLEALHKKGYIEFQNYVPRGIIVIPSTQEEQDEIDEYDQRQLKIYQEKLDREEASNSLV